MRINLHKIALYSECGGELVYRMAAPYSREIRRKNDIEFLGFLKNCAHPGMFDEDTHEPNLRYVKLLLRPITSINIDDLKEFAKIVPPENPLSDTQLRHILIHLQKNGYQVFASLEALDFDDAVQWFNFLIEKQFDVFGLIEKGKAFNILTHPNNEEEMVKQITDKF